MESSVEKSCVKEAKGVVELSNSCGVLGVEEEEEEEREKSKEKTAGTTGLTPYYLRCEICRDEDEKYDCMGGCGKGIGERCVV